ncbi:hypothetical protein HELRODRAFT_170177 [Helobdella robusta]|uniref:Uncharacterized protein n=1 Tax=Helobdella robusta TaxID=6412 RepID=T1F2R2_HELRO|nr:hypothetical protein HELRODRAFT_170177 [Helobdella robusta]ESO07650.1 hypothetical protein HELRODRAFT_170177 [Helobdella robusta]
MPAEFAHSSSLMSEKLQTAKIHYDSTFGMLQKVYNKTSNSYETLKTSTTSTNVCAFVVCCGVVCCGVVCCGVVRCGVVCCNVVYCGVVCCGVVCCDVVCCGVSEIGVHVFDKKNMQPYINAYKQLALMTHVLSIDHKAYVSNLGGTSYKHQVTGAFARYIYQIMRGT